MTNLLTESILFNKSLHVLVNFFLVEDSELKKSLLLSVHSCTRDKPKLLFLLVSPPLLKVRCHQHSMVNANANWGPAKKAPVQSQECISRIEIFGRTERIPVSFFFEQEWIWVLFISWNSFVNDHFRDKHFSAYISSACEKLIGTYVFRGREIHWTFLVHCGFLFLSLYQNTFR